MENTNPVVPLSHEIDFSGMGAPLIETPDTWEPPAHVYFGKKLPNGKKAPEPPYVHQEFPRVLYKPIEGKLRTRVVQSTEAKHAAMADGWGLTISEFGVETCPSAETLGERRLVAERDDTVLITEKVEIVRRRGKGQRVATVPAAGQVASVTAEAGAQGDETTEGAAEPAAAAPKARRGRKAKA